jgi:integrase
MQGHVRKYNLKSGDRRWAIVFYCGRRLEVNGAQKKVYRWTRGFKTERAAQTELNKMLKAANDGVYVEPTAQMLNEYLEHWLTAVKPNLAPKTFERYAELVHVNIVPQIGHIKLSKLQPMQIAEFYTWSLSKGRRRKEGGLSLRTVLHIHRLLRKAMKQAVLWQVRSSNPVDAVEAPKPVQKEIEAVPKEQVAAILEAARGSDLFLPILIALCTGMRRGEILALRWSDVDLGALRLVVHQSLEETKAGVRFKQPKTPKARRTIALPPLLIEAIRAHRQQQERNRKLFGRDYSNNELILPLADGSPWPPDSFTDSFTALIRRMEIAGQVRFHDLRHTHASEMLRRGVPVRTVSQRLGHANPSITLNVYAHLMSGDDERAAQVVEETVGKSLLDPQHKEEK